jgi:hypothetical protein
MVAALTTDMEIAIPPREAIAAAALRNWLVELGCLRLHAVVEQQPTLKMLQ